MKNAAKIAFLMFIAISAIGFPGNAAGAPARDAGVTFKDAEGKDWILLELKRDEIIIPIDRQKLAAYDMGGVYTIYFQEGRLNGLGAPNRYQAPYSTGGNRSLSIGNIASTLMFSFIEPDGLKEREYFDYLSGANRWDLWEGKLELYCSGSKGDKVVLVYTQK